MMATMAIPETNAGQSLRVELRRVIRAPRQRVFAAWTDPEQIRKWMGPGMIAVSDVQTDARPGGAYRIEMKGSIDGNPEASERRVAVSGVYAELRPDELIQFTWIPGWHPGEESLVTVHLRDVEGGTEVLLIHERFADEQSRSGHLHGWNSSMDKLERYLAG
jgi:uncharacterized protein YndB with AHSA1/START domain